MDRAPCASRCSWSSVLGPESQVGISSLLSGDRDDAGLLRVEVKHRGGRHGSVLGLSWACPGYIHRSRAGADAGPPMAGTWPGVLSPAARSGLRAQRWHNPRHSAADPGERRISGTVLPSSPALPGSATSSEEGYFTFDRLMGRISRNASARLCFPPVDSCGSRVDVLMAECTAGLRLPSVACHPDCVSVVACIHLRGRS